MTHEEYVAEIKRIQSEITRHRYVSIFCGIVMLAFAIMVLITLMGCQAPLRT